MEEKKHQSESDATLDLWLCLDALLELLPLLLLLSLLELLLPCEDWDEASGLLEPDADALPLLFAFATSCGTSSDRSCAFRFLPAARLQTTFAAWAFALPFAFALARGWALFLASSVSAASSSWSVGAFPVGSFNADNLMSKSPSGKTSEDFIYADVWCRLRSWWGAKRHHVWSFRFASCLDCSVGPAIIARVHPVRSLRRWNGQVACHWPCGGRLSRPVNMNRNGPQSNESGCVSGTVCFWRLDFFSITSAEADVSAGGGGGAGRGATSSASARGTSTSDCKAAPALDSTGLGRHGSTSFSLSEGMAFGGDAEAAVGAMLGL